jgi:hypothetical protein
MTTKSSAFTAAAADLFVCMASLPDDTEIFHHEARRGQLFDGCSAELWSPKTATTELGVSILFSNHIYRKFLVRKPQTSRQGRPSVEKRGMRPQVAASPILFA